MSSNNLCSCMLIIMSYFSIMYPGDGTPDCSCGKGKMELRCAGKNALHAGRYYLKCPADGQHPGSFKWYDEYRNAGLKHTYEEKDKRGRDIRSVAPPMNRNYSNVVCARCRASKSTTEMKINVLICLVFLLIVAACLMMGKFM